MLLATAATALIGCAGLFGPPRYTFSTFATLKNPVITHHLDEGIAIAKDGHSQHTIVELTKDRICFLSRLDDVSPRDAQASEITLMGFRTEEDDASQVPSITSDQVLLKSTSERLKAGTGSPRIVEISIIESCFARPEQVLTADTSYLVLGVISNRTNSGTLDGAWKLVR